MTIRDLIVRFGFDVDRNSERQAEGSIRGIKSMATKVLGAIGIVFSIKGLSELAETAAEAEALKSQFTQVFSEMEQEASSRLNAIADDTGVAVNRMKGSFVQIAAFAKTTGMETADAMELSDRAMKAVADSAAFYDRSMEDVTDSLQSFLKGNFEQDSALGLSCTEVTRNTAANELYGKSFKDLAEDQKQLTLLKMVEDANTASGALGQAARESDTWTNQLGNLKQALTDLKAAAGSTFLKPAVSVLKVLTALVQRATKAIEGLTAENGMLTRATERYHALVKRLQPAIDRMAQTLSKGLNKGIEVAKNVVDKLGGIENVMKILAIAAAAFLLVMNWSKIISGAKLFMKLISGIAKLFSLANLKILAVVAVIVILALIVEDFINFLLGNDSVIGTIFDKMGIGADNARQAIFNAFNKIKEFLLNVWDFLKTAALMWIDTVKGFFERHGESIRANFERAWGIIKTFLQGVWTFISQLAATLFGSTEDNIDGSTQSTKENLLSVWQAILDALSAVWDALYEAASAIFNALATTIETVFGWIQTFWNNWGSQILSWFKVLWDAIGGILNGFLEVVKGVANFIASVFTGDWQGAWEAIKQIFTGIWDMIVSFITAIWETIKLLFSMALEAIKAVWEAIWNGIKSFFEMIWNGIVSFFQGIWDTIVSVVTTFLSVIQTVWNAVWSAISSFFQGLWNGIVSFLQGVWSTITGVISGAINGAYNIIVSVLTAIQSFFSNTFSGIASFVSSTFSNILSGITSAVTSIKDAIVNGFNAAIDFIKGLPSQAIQWGKDFIGGLKDGIMSGVQGIVDAVKGIGDKIRSFLHFSVPDEGPLTDYESWMPDFMGGMAEGIAKSEDTVLDKVKGVASGISMLMKGATASASTAGASAVNNTTSSITQNVNIDNTYSGGSAETQKNVSRAMKKSAVDATTQMARGLAYARG